MSQQRTETFSEMPLRPVLLVDKGVFSNYSHYIRRVLISLAGASHQAAIVCPTNINSQLLLCPSVLRIEHPALRLPIFYSQNRRMLLNHLRRFKPTVIHAFYPGQPRLARWLSKKLDIPYVLMFHKIPKRWFCMTKPVHAAAGIIAASDIIHSRLSAELPAAKDPVERIHIATFVDDNCCCFSRPSALASLITVHPFNSLKQFEPFLNAVRHLVLDGMEVMVALMGTGPAEKAIRAHIRKLGLTAIVTVVPPIRPVRSILSGADIYVHLSDRGLFDAQLLEAMSVGLSVAGSPDSSSGLLFDGQTASFWDPQDELSIYACLKGLLGQRDKTRQIAQNAQTHLRSHHSVSRMADKLKRTYIEAQQCHKQNRTTPEKPKPAEAS